MCVLKLFAIYKVPHLLNYYEYCQKGNEEIESTENGEVHNKKAIAEEIFGGS